MYRQPAMTSGPMQGMDNPAYSVDLQEAHDHIAIVQQRPCAPARESQRWHAAMRRIREASSIQATPIVTSASTHLEAAHNAIASHLRLDCAQSRERQERRTMQERSRTVRQKPTNQLEERILQLDWHALCDRTRPLPPDITLEALIKQFEQYAVVLYAEQSGLFG